VVAVPKIEQARFQCFWSTGTGWGTFSLHRENGSVTFAIKVLMGTLPCRSCEFAARGNTASVNLGGAAIKHQTTRHEQLIVVTFGDSLHLAADQEIRIEVRG
jgi:hypothetical protein